METSELFGADLERRLIGFSVLVTDLLEMVPDRGVANHIVEQLLRSGRLPGPAGAEGAEPDRETAHTMQRLLNELHETSVWLRIIRSKSLMEAPALLEKALEECHQLMAIMISGLAVVHTPAQETIPHAYALSSGH